MRKLAACLIVMGTLVACDGLPVERKWVVEELASVADAPKHHPDSEVLRITGVPRADLAGVRTWRVSGSRQIRGADRVAIVVPIVPEGWTKADHVPLWIRMDAGGTDASSPEMQRRIAELEAALQTGPIEVLVLRHVDLDHDVENSTDAFLIGAVDAIRRHGLVSPETAPITSWPVETKPKLRMKKDE